MPRLQYHYSRIANDSIATPWAPAFAVNLLTGKFTPFMGILDTGSDQVCLSEDLLRNLEINPGDLPEISIGGVDGVAPARSCDYLKICLADSLSPKCHFPNGDSPVPVHFSREPFSLLGREQFLDRCKVIFDGPRQSVLIEW